MATEVSICSNALRRLGDDPITSLTDDTERARLCNSFYPDARDAVLRLHTWNFAVTRASLAQLAAAPAYGFAYQYSLPSDCLRVLQIKDYNLDYKIEGRKLLINEDTVFLIYLAQITDVNELDVLLRETISAGLASDISYAITANLQVTKLMTEKYGLKLSEARHTDASEGYNTDPTLGNTDQVISEDFLNSRY